MGEVTYDIRHLFDRVASLRGSKSPSDAVPGLHNPVIKHQHAALDRIDARLRRAAKEEAENAKVITEILTQLIQYLNTAFAIPESLLHYRKTQSRSGVERQDICPS